MSIKKKITSDSLFGLWDSNTKNQGLPKCFICTWTMWIYGVYAADEGFHNFPEHKATRRSLTHTICLLGVNCGDCWPSIYNATLEAGQAGGTQFWSLAPITRAKESHKNGCLPTSEYFLNPGPALETKTLDDSGGQISPKIEISFLHLRVLGVSRLWAIYFRIISLLCLGVRRTLGIWDRGRR